MTIEAKIICDSVSSAGIRLTTFVLTYPRFIHSEFMTHRVFSRNSSSSRAIPVSKQIQEVVDNPAMPLKFLENKKGMQAGEQIENPKEAEQAWLWARDKAVDAARELVKLNVHKQFVNRLLEPFAHITVIVTSTEWNNFFDLRYHVAAQPEIHELAKIMWNKYIAEIPDELKDGEWHIPFSQLADNCNSIEERLKISVARCARVSYKKHDGTTASVEEDFDLYDRLLGSAPIHASPAEHQAMAIGNSNVRSGNFRGWIQFRQIIERLRK